MAAVTGGYKATNILTIANAITLIDAHLDVEHARITALGGAATKIVGGITLSIKAENGAAVSFVHKITHTINSPLLADVKTLTAALSVFATAVETESSFTTVTEVDVSMNTVMTN